MSETNSLNFLDQSTPSPQSTGKDAARPINAVGNALFERIGVGGMGEVYRCGDDALQRDLAIKILKAELHGNADAEERFLREARLTGSLQHPGIVPVHHLGQLADGRPCYTMKLVRGRTFADLLREEPEGPERLPRLLAVLEKICQAVAYAHSKHAIHRDLKPSNVMVGEFGEVQVMDWGLAKELSRTEPAPPTEATEGAETAAWTEEAEGLSRAGSALGTPAYMPPEQAAGDWDIVDERADVFALGAILCEMLTGQPPYRGANRDDLLRRARRGDLSEALGRLEKCGADAVLVNLCRECLAAERLERPRHAGVVAERLAAYQAEVQERLRRAELERTRAEVKALEERKRRRLIAALALMALILLAGGGYSLWCQKIKQERTERSTLAVLEHGRQQLDEGWRLHDLAILREAKAEAERAADIASGGVSDAVEQQVADFRTLAEERLDRAEKNRVLLNALVDIAVPHETKNYQFVGAGQKVMALVEPSVEEQYATAFRRRWPDVNIEKEAVSAAAARLQEEPEVVLQGVIAGLDGWMLELRRQKGSEAKWRRLLRLVECLDHSEPRRQLRALLTGAVPHRAEDVAELMGGWPPWIALWKLERGNEWRHLRQIRGQMDATSEPVLTVLLLAQASREVGDEAGAETVLRQALARRPDEVALLDALGKLLYWRYPSRWTEAIGCYRAIRARRPELGLALARALDGASQSAEREAILRDLVRQQPRNPEIVSALGNALFNHRKYAEAEAVYGKLIAENPDDVQAYNTLGMILHAQEKYADEEAAYRKAVALNPDDALAYRILGWALHGKKKYKEAETLLRKATALEPENDRAHDLLVYTLIAQEKYAEAEAVCRKAISLKPDDSWALNQAPGALVQSFLDDKINAYNTLGQTLNSQGKYAEAEATYRQAIALKPNDVGNYAGLAGALDQQGKLVEAEATYRKAITLRPVYDWTFNDFAGFLVTHGKYAEAEAIYRKAISLRPNDAKGYISLGQCLICQRKHAEAEAAYRKAISLKPDDAQPYGNFGSCLSELGKHGEAEAAYRKALSLKPDDALACSNLCRELNHQGKHSEAESVYHKFITQHSDDAQAYLQFGIFLQDLGKPVEAEALLRKAIALKPDDGWAYFQLGEVSRLQGQFEKSLAACRRGYELESKQPDSRFLYDQWVRPAERLVEIEKKLPEVFQGKGSPPNPEDAVLVAKQMYEQYRKRYASSARLYADAFAAEPKLAADFDRQLRYTAACSAALAAADQGEDARSLSDKERSRLRRQALGWLRDDLTACAKLAEQNKPDANKTIQQTLAHWRSDPDLASVRDPQALERLPENERADWQALWRDVDKLAKRAAKMDEAEMARKKAK